jgi:hypothetical protein
MRESQRQTFRSHSIRTIRACSSPLPEQLSELVRCLQSWRNIPGKRFKGGTPMNNLTRRNLLAGAAGATAATVLPFEMPVKAATPPAGKQAPGWYRYKIGTIEITVATDGVARFKMAEDHVTNIKLDAVNAALAKFSWKRT